MAQKVQATSQLAASNSLYDRRLSSDDRLENGLERSQACGCPTSECECPTSECDGLTCHLVDSTTAPNNNKTNHHTAEQAVGETKNLRAAPKAHIRKSYVDRGMDASLIYTIHKTQKRLSMIGNTMTLDRLDSPT